MVNLYQVTWGPTGVAGSLQLCIVGTHFVVSRAAVHVEVCNDT